MTIFSGTHQCCITIVVFTVDKSFFSSNALTHAEAGIHTISFDEKTGIQARQPATPDKPIKPGKTVRRDYEYIRHGTQTLLAGMNVVTGKIIPLVSET